MPVSSTYFQPETLRRISRLELRARYLVEGFLSGMHKSRHFGNSVEFRQHRQYVPGDDPRNVDWKVWGKQDRLYVKQYEVDTNFRCNIVFDVSRSMEYGFGPLNKHDYACTIAASVAYLAVRQRDAVGCVTFDKETDRLLPSRTKQTHLNAIIATLQQKPQPDSTDEAIPEKMSFQDLMVRFSELQPNMRESLRETAELIPPHGLVVLISDLLVSREGLFQGLRFLRSRNHDVLVLHVLDDDELDFTFSGPTRFEGLELPGSIRCDPRMLRDGYLEALGSYLEEIRRGCSQNQIDYALFRTSQPLDAALSEYLSRRNAMIRSAVRK